MCIAGLTRHKCQIYRQKLNCKIVKKRVICNICNNTNPNMDRLMSKIFSSKVSLLLLSAILVASPMAFSAAPDVKAKLQDQLKTDVDTDGKVDRGDTVTYQAEVDNTTGTDEAQNVVFDATLDTDTTLDTGSIKVTPVAVDDSFNSLGNVTLSVSAADGLLKNDFDPKDANTPTNAGMTVTAGVFSTTDGNSVTVSADGSFTFNPVANYTGTDTFTYTANDSDAMTDTGTVTISVAGKVLFVDDSAAAGGDGSQANPFNNFTDLDAVSVAGDTIYLFEGTYADNLTLKANQSLVGSGADLTSGASVIIPGGTAPTYTGTMSLANNVTIEGFAFAPANVYALSGSGVTGGSISASTMTLSGTAGAVNLTNHVGNFLYTGSMTGASSNSAVVINGGNATHTINGGISLTGGRLVDVQNTTGGGLSVSGALVSNSGSAININNNSGNPSFQFASVTVTSGSGTAVNFTSNGASTYSFSGDFNITTSSGAGLIANSGTLSLADVNTFTNQVNATGGQALDLNGVAVGTLGFDSLASTNSGSEGVNLDNLTGTVTVLGNVDISNPTGTGFDINGGSASYNLTTGTLTVNSRNTAALTIDGSSLSTVAFGDITVGSLSSGNSVGVSVANTTNAVTAGALQVANSGGSGVAINNTSGGVTFSSINLGTSGNIAVNGVAITGTNSNNINLGSGSINNVQTVPLDIQGGTANVTYTGSIIKSSGNSPLLLVSGHSVGTLNLNTGTLSATVGTGLSFANADGTYNLNGTVTLNGGDAGLDILSGSSGTVTLANTSITNPTGTAINIDGSSAVLNYNAGTVSQSNAASGLIINNNTGGTINIVPNMTFNTATANAANITNNTGTTINLSGQLDIDTTSGSGFTASGGGTLSVTNTNNTVNTTTGQLISLNGMTIGASGIDFNSAVASGVVVADGVNLANVTGGNFVLDNLTVAGSAANIDGIEINASAANSTIGSAIIDNTGGAGINLTGSNGTVTFTSVNIDGNTGTGVQITNNTSPVNINGGAIGSTNDPAGIAFDISGGSGNITSAASITNATNRAIEVTGRTAGTVTFSGAISETGTGINLANNTGGTTIFSNASKVINTGSNQAVTLANNTGHTINFTNGGLDIDTTTAGGFSASVSGTVNVSGNNNTINTTTGTALNVANTTIGASNLNFRSISANGATNGIILNNTGTSGGLTVTGDGGSTTLGGNNSGGQLQNTSIAMLLTNTQDVSLRDMGISNSTFHHLDASTVTNLTLNEINFQTAGVGASSEGGVQGSSITNLNISNSIFNAGGDTGNEHGVAISNLFGTSTIQSSTFSNSGAIQFFVQNTSATSTINFYGNTFNLHNGAFFGDNLSVEAAGTSTINLNVGDGTVGNANTFDTGQDGVQATSSTTGTMNVVINRNTRTNGTGTGFNVGAFNSSNITFDINNNTVTDTGSTGINANSVGTTNTSVITGHIRNNTITRVGQGGTGFYINHIIEGAGTGTINIQSNVASGGTGNPNLIGESGFRVQGRDPSNVGNLTMNVTIQSNTVSDTGFRGIEVESGSSVGGTGETVCLNMLNNNSSAAFGDAGYRLRQRAGATFNLQNFVGNGASAADITAWINTTKSNTGTTSISIASSFSASAGNCPTPP